MTPDQVESLELGQRAAMVEFAKNERREQEAARKSKGRK